MALEEHGPDYVHRYVGREPSGLNFNELALGEAGEPHNPMINAGAIMCSSMLRQELDLSERFDYLLEAWSSLCGNNKPVFNNSVYLSEKKQQTGIMHWDTTCVNIMLFPMALTCFNH